MIEFFPPGTTIFEGGTLLPKSFDARVTHERNGKFDLEFKYPLKDLKYMEFKQKTIFYTDVPYMKKQAMYLSSIKKRNGYVEVYAKHLFFLLSKNVTKDIKSSNVIGPTIISRFTQSLQIPHNFTFYTNITDSHAFNEPGYANAMDVFAEGKHSILGQWGGVLVMENWDIKLLQRFGRDTEYLVAKRKNINDIEIDEDGEGVVTRLFLTAELDNDEVIEAIVDSPLIDEYPQVYGEVRESSNEKIKTKADLIKYGEDIFRLQRIDLPDESFTVDVTDDVKEYEFTIDDTALIYYEDYDLYKRIVVTSYEYDPMSHKYLKIRFGDKKKTLSQQTSEKVEKDIVKPQFNIISEIIKDITNKLGDPTGGIIKFIQDNEGNIIEILITDNDNLELAMDIWRMNIQGISHSSTGINGEFDIAMTQDGKIVADFIATGVLNANLIKAGMLRSLDGSTWIDMESGYFNFKDRIIFDKDGFILRLSNGKTIEQEVSDNVDNSIQEATTTMQSNLEQTEELIRREVTENYTAKSDFETYQSQVSTKFDQTSEDFLFQFTELTQQISNLDDDTKAQFNELIKYIRFENGNIILGEVGNEITLKIQNDRIAFLQNNLEVAYLSNNTLYITDTRVLNSIRIGNFAFIPRSNGNLSFKKVGE
ncbi:phage tail spike protein [Senegalia massiliensis]|uniref:Tail spike domain-containing protein n=1 Tax=Senegalia massiliensis TaxID=1720316 RepID=A0A845R1F8_9CLOT|nr:phage tail spike protein [Senegalia massiliensis]NBI08250.1 hypothetical protein [Senegalia massiliensis]